MKLMFAIGSLRAGGAERVMSLLAGELAHRGHEVTVITLSDPDEDFFDVSPLVRRVSIGFEGDSRNVFCAAGQNLRRALALRKLFREHRPDVVLSFLTTMNVLVSVASKGLRHGLVVSERVDPSQHSAGRVWDWLRMRGYRRADAIVVQTESVALWFRSRLPRRSPRVVVIPNPVAPDVQIHGSADREGGGTYVLGVGRLEDQKGFDLLIEAFARLSPAEFHCELWIAGRGSRRQVLERQAVDLGIADRVRFLGEVDDVTRLMRDARVFVLPSRFEGFPNALLEAMASGAPCVAADCPSGPKELLSVDECGLLVPVGDADRLAQAIRRVLRDSELSTRLSAAGRRAADAYLLSAIAERWEQVFREAAGRR